MINQKMQQLVERYKTSHAELIGTREDYIAWRAQWRVRYRELSRLSRACKYLRRSPNHRVAGPQAHDETETKKEFRRLAGYDGWDFQSSTCWIARVQRDLLSQRRASKLIAGERMRAARENLVVA